MSSFHRWHLPPALHRSLRLVLQRAGFQSNWYLVVLAAGVGTVTALGAWGFTWLLQVITWAFLGWWAGTSAHGLPPSGEATHAASEVVAALGGWTWVLLVAAPTLGALLCGIIVHFGAPEAKGHGVPEVMIALYRKKGRIRPQVALFKSIASALTIGSGGSAGAEGPIVQIGSAIGSNVGRYLRISPEHTGTLLGCGAAAGIAAVFNAPIAGIFFVLEILLRDFSVRTFTPIVIASVFSASVTRAIKDAIGTSEHAGAVFQVSGLLEHYEFALVELPYFFVLGIVCGMVAVMFILALDWSEGVYDRIKIHPIIKPVTGGLLLGIMSVGVLAIGHPIGGDSPVPAYYGNGYDFIRSAISHEFYVDAVSDWLMLGLLVVMVLKLVATCLTLGSGGSGGVFAPSLFLGAALGGGFGMAANALDVFGVAVSPAAFALVGMAAMVAGTTHAPLTAIIMLFELTEDYKVILPIMLAAVLSTVIAQVLLPGSIYTLKVRRRGVRIGHLSDLTVLRRISVADVPLARAVTVRPEDPAQRLLNLAEMHGDEDFVVVDRENRYVGMITGEDLRMTLLQVEALPLLVVSEIMRTDLPTTTRDETLDQVMDEFSRHNASSLAVLDVDGDGRVLGVITRSRMMRQYHMALQEA